MALRSMKPRSLAGPGSSSTPRNRKGMAPRQQLTDVSSSASPAVTSVRPAPGRFAAMPGPLRKPQDAGREVPVLRARATPRQQPKYRAPMVSAASAHRAAVLLETAPQSALAACVEGVSADPDHAKAGTRAGARLPRFKEEVDPALGPAHATAAFCEETGPADSSLQPVHQLVESRRVGESVNHGGGCSAIASAVPDSARPWETVTVSSRLRNAGSRNSRYRRPAKKTIVSTPLRQVSRCAMTSSAHARRSSILIAFSVRS